MWPVRHIGLLLSHPQPPNSLTTLAHIRCCQHGAEWEQVAQVYTVLVQYKSLHRLAPPYLSDECQLVTDVGRRHLRSADVHTCTVPRTQSRLGDRSFGVTGPRLRNSLPAELRQQDICLTEFRRLLKTFLFAETRRIVTSLAPGISTLTYLLTYMHTIKH